MKFATGADAPKGSAVVRQGGGSIRASGWYVRTGNRWRETARQLTGGADTAALPLYGDSGDDTTALAPGEADDVVRVDASAIYRGVRFEIGRLWDAAGQRVRGEVPADAAEITALLFRHGPDDREIADAVPGATYHDPRGSNGGVSVRAPVADLTEYTEVIQRIR